MEVNDVYPESIEEVTSSDNLEVGCCEHNESEECLDNKKAAPKRGRPKKIRKVAEKAVTKNKNKKEPKEKHVKPKEPKSKKSKKVDALKPQFVNGTPVNPFQNEPAVANPYGYDPLAEVMELGKGQLQSAYRNTKNNIAPPKDKKMYKLEHKHEDGIPDKPACVPLYGTPLEEHAGDTGIRG